MKEIAEPTLADELGLCSAAEAYRLYAEQPEPRSLMQLELDLINRFGDRRPPRRVVNDWWRIGAWDSRLRKEKRKAEVEEARRQVVQSVKHEVIKHSGDIAAARIAQMADMRDISASAIALMRETLSGGRLKPGHTEDDVAVWEAEGRPIHACPWAVPPLRLTGTVAELKALAEIVVVIGKHERETIGEAGGEEDPFTDRMDDDEIADRLARALEKRRRRASAAVEVTTVGGGGGTPGEAKRDPGPTPSKDMSSPLPVS